MPQLSDDHQIQEIIHFPASDRYGAFQDALYIPYGQYKKLTQTQLDAMKQARYDAWKQIIDNPPPTPAPSPVDQNQQVLDALAAAQSALAAAQDALTGE